MLVLSTDRSCNNRSNTSTFQLPHLVMLANVPLSFPGAAQMSYPIGSVKYKIGLSLEHAFSHQIPIDLQQRSHTLSIVYVSLGRSANLAG